MSKCPFLRQIDVTKFKSYLNSEILMNLIAFN